MQVNFLFSDYSIASKPIATLLCALLLSACNSKLIEPIRIVAAPSQAATRLENDLAAPKTANYGVPDASNVSFITDAPDQVLDLAY
jgi:hypothetical protein